MLGVRVHLIFINQNLLICSNSKMINKNLIKIFKFEINFNLNSLIYINNDCGKKYLLDSYQRNNLIIIELKYNYNNYEIKNYFNDDTNKNKLSDFLKREDFYDICNIYGKNKFYFLYIFKRK